MDTTTDSFALYKRLLKTYVWRYRRKLILGSICMVLMAGTAAAQAYLTKPLLDDVFISRNAQALLWLPIAIVLVTLVNALSDYGESLCIKYVGQRVVTDMQADMFDHLMHADISLFHDQSSGRLISRLTNDIMLMRQSVSQVVTGLVKEGFTAIFLLCVMFWQSVNMSLIAFGVLIFGVLPIIRLGKKMRRVASDTQAQLADFTSQLDDIFQGVRMVKAYSREDFESERARNIMNRLFKLYYRASRVQSGAGPIMTVLAGLGIASIIWYSGGAVMEDKMTTGTFFSFIAAMLMVYRPIKIIAGLNTQLQEGMAAAARFFTLIDTKPNIQNDTNATTLNVAKGEINFNQVTFHYAQSSHGVEDLTFTVPAGKTVALVGASGSGKTTIMNLLLRFYDAQKGTITIDAQNIRGSSIHSLRSAFALVSQDIVLFNETVRTNIAYGKLDATDDEIIEAAKKAHAHEFISALPEGYNTPIGPSGVKLSGGQRQRISIARAILKNAPILLLDEATSALDTASERAVQEALTDLMQNRTTLVIAHRLTTIQDADIILVLANGKITASGTHQQLLESSTIYRTMHQLSHQHTGA